ncbi:LysE family translocator [Erwinia oleae]|uniref:LysE family translocator n=1 Tax=Erwinia oleae TaxID=796334 RepID=UPI00054D78E8|nr:LysE family transporter [Erwinia oleae]
MSQELTTIFGALAIYAAVVLSPGPNFTLITRLATSDARSAALGATFGFSVGAMVYAVLSMTGLALIITRVGWLVTFVQIAGGGYLIYLGLSAWFTSTAKTLNCERRRNINSAARGFRMGLIVELSNPKGIAFFVSFFAVAIPMETALWAKAVILAGGFFLEIVWYGAASFLLSTRPVRTVYERFAMWIERAIGTLLAVFGVRLIWEKI